MKLTVIATFMREARNGEGCISAAHLLGVFDEEARARAEAERAGRQGFWASFSYFVPPASLVCIQLIPESTTEGANR